MSHNRRTLQDAGQVLPACFGANSEGRTEDLGVRVGSVVVSQLSGGPGTAAAVVAPLEGPWVDGE
jgi:hypothetical protein